MNQLGLLGYDGKVYHNNGSAADLGTFGDTDIVGVYIDLDNHKLYFVVNGLMDLVMQMTKLNRHLFRYGKSD